MDLVSLIVILVVVGLIMYFINAYVPMQGQIKNLMNAVVVIVLVLWLLSLFVHSGYLPNIRIGR